MKNDRILYDLLKREQNQRAKENLLSFTLYTKPDYEVNWHHRVSCKYLDRFINKEITRLIFEMPPREGKSELVSRRLPPAILGRFPTSQIIAASYGADLASRMNRDVQRIIDDPAYREIYPDVFLSGENVRTVAYGSHLRNNDIFEIVGHRGVYRSAGVGGGITGMGANYAIIDDPIKNQDEADSMTYREKVWEWFTSTLYTRLEKNGSILITMTRWHEDDLVGRLIRLSKEDPNADQWTVVSFPAIKENDDNPLDPRKIGEALWPNKYDLETLGKIRSSVGSRVWNALFQQRPAPSEGAIIKREWLRFYDEIPEQLEETIITVDATFTGKATSDFVAIEVWGRFGANKYLLDLRHERMGITETIHALMQMVERYPNATLKLIENKANGPAIEDLLKTKVSGIVLWEPRGDKVSRLNAVSPQFEAGNVWFPKPAFRAWIDSFIDELITFPNSIHDDRVDALTMALIRLEESCSSGVGYMRIIP